MRLALIGYGRMGQAVERLATLEGHEVVTVVDPAQNESTLEALSAEDIDMAVEFTVPEAAPANIRALARQGISVVVGTTGWAEQLTEVTETVDQAGTGLFHAANFSVGVHIFYELTRRAAQLADRAGGYDIHLAEAHHRHKADHPSGTAIRLAEIVVGESREKTSWAASLTQGPVDRSVLGISCTRAGDNPGTHCVSLDGADDVIELRHQARGREGFARGALRAAQWLQGRRGVYSMRDLVGELLAERGLDPGEET